MDRRDVDVAVVGAGVVGLACAAELARRGRSVVVLERHEGPGRETSSRNSGVIHAGLYYPPGSLKARTCARGRALLYARCEAMGIPHRRTGKLVVATAPEELESLETIRAQGIAAGAGALELLDDRELTRREPMLDGVGAVWSPESGVVDAHALMDSYLAEAREHGAQVAWRTSLVAVEPRDAGVRVVTRGPDTEQFAIDAAWMVNAAGLASDRVASLAGIDVDAAGWRIHPCKGDYFALSSSAPRPSCALVYPVPAGPGLGIHLTTDLGGRCIAGPDATYCDTADSYDVDPTKAKVFAKAVARYLPGVTAAHLTPDYAGIRPKLAPRGSGFRDFVLAEGAAHGAPRTVHLVGIESPGLTAAGALAEEVSDLLG